MDAGVAPQQSQLGASFAQGHEKSQKTAEHVEPRRKAFYLDHDHTGGDPQDEAQGDGQYVEQDDVFQLERVGNLGNQVEEQNDGQSRREKVSGDQAGRREQDGCPRRQARIQ